jgi:hypothetical protein
MLTVVVATPEEVFELERKAPRLRGQRFQHFLCCGHYFFADAVSGDGRDPISLHLWSLKLENIQAC